MQSIQNIADLAVSIRFNKYLVQSTSSSLRLVYNNTVLFTKMNTPDMTNSITAPKFTKENPEIVS